MTSLIAAISSEAPANAHVSRIIESANWEKIILVGETDEFFKMKCKFDFIKIDKKKTTVELAEFLKNELKDKIFGEEVALNLVAGSGRDSMALLSALLKLCFGIRLVAMTKEGIKEI